MQSPYNTANPHFGYPAYVPPSSLDPSGTPRSRFPRRRKRDLVRTLTYLAALRFLALHRSIQHRLNVLVAILLRLTGLGWWNRWWRQGAAGLRRNDAAAAASGSEHKDGSDKKVHWTASPAPSSSLHTVTAPPPTLPGARPVAHSPHHRSHHLHHQHLSSALTSSSSISPTPPPPLINVDPSVLYLMLLFIIVRTPDRKDKVKRLARFLVVGIPTWSAAQARRLALRVLVGKARADALLSAERTPQ